MSIKYNKTYMSNPIISYIKCADFPAMMPPGQVYQQAAQTSANHPTLENTLQKSVENTPYNGMLKFKGLGTDGYVDATWHPTNADGTYSEKPQFVIGMDSDSGTNAVRMPLKRWKNYSRSHPNTVYVTGDPLRLNGVMPGPYNGERRATSITYPVQPDKLPLRETNTIAGSVLRGLPKSRVMDEAATITANPVEAVKTYISERPRNYNDYLRLQTNFGKDLHTDAQQSANFNPKEQNRQQTFDFYDKLWHGGKQLGGQALSGLSEVPQYLAYSADIPLNIALAPYTMTLGSGPHWYLGNSYKAFKDGVTGATEFAGATVAPDAAKAIMQDNLATRDFNQAMLENSRTRLPWSIANGVAYYAPQVVLPAGYRAAAQMTKFPAGVKVVDWATDTTGKALRQTGEFMFKHPRTALGTGITADTLGVGPLGMGNALISTIANSPSRQRMANNSDERYPSETELAIQDAITLGANPESIDLARKTDFGGHSSKDILDGIMEDSKSREAQPTPDVRDEITDLSSEDLDWLESSMSELFSDLEVGSE